MIALRSPGRTRHAALGAWASANGFSLLELLIALTICAVVSAGVAIVVPPARIVFDAVPAELELQQRARTAVDAIMQAIRAAGGDAVASSEFGPLAGVVPAVIPYDAVDARFTRLKVIGPRVNAAQGVLDRHQAGPLGALWLAGSPCADASAVCGFARGAAALIADGSGRFDVFTVASVDAATRRLTADRAFVPPYAAGSVVVEAEVYTFQLEPQPDRTSTLVRVNSGGAVQPVVDRVDTLAFEVSGFDDFGELAPLAPLTLSDGPWWRGNPGGLYDEDVFRIRRVDVALTLRGVEPSNARRSIRFGVVVRNVP
jgi:prepilin-type N-terminal cleavage/methylation domain-containing protein